MHKAQQATMSEGETQRSVCKGKFILSRVVSRKFVGFRPNPVSAPNKILFWVREDLECGHAMPVYPVEGETFTARRRSCHVCLNAFVEGLEGLEAKKPVQRTLHGAAVAEKRKAA